MRSFYICFISFALISCSFFLNGCGDDPPATDTQSETPVKEDSLLEIGAGAVELDQLGRIYLRGLALGTSDSIAGILPGERELTSWEAGAGNPTDKQTISQMQIALADSIRKSF